MALDLGDERIKYIMDVLQQSMKNKKPIDEYDIGVVDNIYRLLDELLIIRHFLNKPKEPETITKENLIKERDAEILMIDLYQILKKKTFSTSDANSPRQRHAKLVLRSIYEILMVVYESEYKSWEKEEC